MAKRDKHNDVAVADDGLVRQIVGMAGRRDWRGFETAITKLFPSQLPPERRTACDGELATLHLLAERLRDSGDFEPLARLLLVVADSGDQKAIGAVFPVVFTMMADEATIEEGSPFGNLAAEIARFEEDRRLENLIVELLVGEPQYDAIWWLIHYTSYTTVNRLWLSVIDGLLSQSEFHPLAMVQAVAEGDEREPPENEIASVILTYCEQLPIGPD